MNKMMLTLAFTALIGGSVMAQNTMQKGDNAGQRSEQLTDMMTKRLKLTTEQIPKVKDINDRFAKELAAVNKERQADPSKDQTAENNAAMQKAKAINAKKDTELKAVLTPEQMGEWTKMEAEMKQKMQEKQQAKQADKKQ